MDSAFIITGFSSSVLSTRFSTTAISTSEHAIPPANCLCLVDGPVDSTSSVLPSNSSVLIGISVLFKTRLATPPVSDISTSSEIHLSLSSQSFSISMSLAVSWLLLLFVWVDSSSDFGQTLWAEFVSLVSSAPLTPLLTLPATSSISE